MDPKTSLIDKTKLPNEISANCSDCRMCGKAGGATPYLETVKCCTYYPFIPNYSVGGILREGGAGAEIIRQMLRQRQWALPIGLVAPPKYQVKFREKHPDEFGRNVDFSCPFLQQGRCSVWQHRNSECSTYFCTHDEGQPGEEKWKRIGEDIFAEEMHHSQNLMLECGYLLPEVERNLVYVKFLSDNLSADEKPYEMAAPFWNSIWAHWVDRTEAYYLKCWDSLS